VTEHNPVTPWCYSGLGCGQTYLYGFLGVIGSSANLLVERVGFDGGPGPLPTGRNYNNGPFFLGLSIDNPLTVKFKLVSSRIGNGEDSLLIWAVRNAQIAIGGAPSDGNVFELGASGGAIIDPEDSVFEYTCNYVDVCPWAGLFLVQSGELLPQKPSRFLIQHNTFKASRGPSMAFTWRMMGRLSGWRRPLTS
jgi:hypothetical protein